MPYRAILIVGVILIAAYAIITFSQNNASPPYGAVIVEVLVPELDGTAKSGELAYNANCAACHGKNAAGQKGVGPPLVHKIYEPSHHGDMAFVLAAQQGIRAHHWPFGDMPPVEGISDEEIQAIIAYIRTLQRSNGIN